MNFSKFSLILIFSLVFSTSSFAKTGEGDLKLNSGALDYFITYLKGGNNQWPESFIISEDSSWYTYYFCAYGPGKCAGSDMPAIAQCRKATGKKCGTFAKGRTVKWKNGMRTQPADFTSLKGDKTIKFFRKLTNISMIRCRPGCYPSLQ